MNMSGIKKIIKQLAAFSPIPLTKNEQYDRLTQKVISKIVSPNITCVDIGCNEGKILQMMVDALPNTKHFAFEPIPVLYKALQEKFHTNAHLFNMALSNKKEVVNFNLVLTDMAYSGLQKGSSSDDKERVDIEVQTDLLDNIVDKNTQVGLIKIDVEGAELLVLQGSVETILRNKPIILFEFGKIGAEAYNNNDVDMFNFFTNTLGYNIYTLKSWLANGTHLSLENFSDFYNNDQEYFYLAAAKA